MIYEHSGDKSILAILNSPISNEEEFYRQVEKLTGWNKKEFTKKWEEKISLLAAAEKK